MAIVCNFAIIFERLFFVFFSLSISPQHFLLDMQVVWFQDLIIVFEHLLGFFSLSVFLSK